LEERQTLGRGKGGSYLLSVLEELGGNNQRRSKSASKRGKEGGGHEGKTLLAGRNGSLAQEFSGRSFNFEGKPSVTVGREGGLRKKILRTWWRKWNSFLSVLKGEGGSSPISETLGGAVLALELLEEKERHYLSKR